MDLETRQLQQRLLQAQQLPEVLLLKPTTTSTNDDVREIAQKGIQSILVCSYQQTHGRGQRQRQWVSPEGNIYLSTLLHTQIPIDGRLALEIALNILQMPSLAALKLQVKWPNDLYSEQGKWGGILIEPLSSTSMVVGVGMNLYPITTQLDQHNTSLQQLGLTQIDRVQIMSELYLAIQQAGQWFSYNSHNLASRFNHHAAFLNQEVTFEHRNGQLLGRFMGIQNDGAVCISHHHQSEVFYEGRLRLAQGAQ